MMPWTQKNRCACGIHNGLLSGNSDTLFFRLGLFPYSSPVFARMSLSFWRRVFAGPMARRWVHPVLLNSVLHGRLYTLGGMNRGKPLRVMSSVRNDEK